MDQQEEESRAQQELQLQDNMSRRAGVEKKHFKPTVALMPEKLNKDVKPEEFSRWREQWISWRNEAVGDELVLVKKLIQYIKNRLDSFWDMRVGHKFKEDKTFEDNLDIIKNELLQLYLLIKRRRDLFERKQSDS